MILRAQDLGLATALVPLAYFGFNIVYTALAMPLGHLSDRLGRRGVIAAGYLVMSARWPQAWGDIVLISFPFTDLSTSKLRPALIVRRPSGDDIIVAFITSHVTISDPQAEHLLEPVDPEFRATGLKGPLLIRLNKLVTLHRDLVRRRLGRIGPQTERAVARCLRYVFEI